MKFNVSGVAKYAPASFKALCVYRIVLVTDRSPALNEQKYLSNQTNITICSRLKIIAFHDSSSKESVAEYIGFDSALREP